jgi:hypothetical protein
MCQDEGCVAGTTDYPNAPLCSDANICTTDSCSNPGTGQGTCVHTANATFCDDGVFCNGDDRCGGGSCSVHAGNPCTGGPECRATCDEDAGQCADPAGSACTDDGNPCTNDTCNGQGACVHGANAAPCDDGVFCNGSDTCSGGSCALHAGDPCSGADDGDGDCAESCDEAGGACDAPDPNGSACDDGVYCNGADTCVAGGCDGHAGNPCQGGAACTEETQSCAASCVHGDCNASGSLDAGDPICTVLCLTGAPPGGADCACAADCNCSAGTDAGDPVCDVLRLIGAFSPDTCAAP